MGIGLYVATAPDREKAKQQEVYNTVTEQTKSLGSQVLEMIDSGNLDGAKYTLTNFSVPKEFSDNEGSRGFVQVFDPMYLALIKAYIKNGNYDEAEEVGSSFRLKINNDWDWVDTSCYKTLKQEFKKKGRDFSALKSDDDD